MAGRVIAGSASSPSSASTPIFLAGTMRALWLMVLTACFTCVWEQLLTKKMQGWAPPPSHYVSLNTTAPRPSCKDPSMPSLCPSRGFSRPVEVYFPWTFKYKKTRDWCRTAVTHRLHTVKTKSRVAAGRDMITQRAGPLIFIFTVLSSSFSPTSGSLYSHPSFHCCPKGLAKTRLNIHYINLCVTVH